MTKFTQLLVSRLYVLFRHFLPFMLLSVESLFSLESLSVSTVRLGIRDEKIEFNFRFHLSKVSDACAKKLNYTVC